MTYTFKFCSDSTNVSPAAVLVIPTGTKTYDANAEIETQSVTAEDRISKVST